MNPEEYYPIPPTKIQKAIICTPEEVQMWKDENLKLKTRITALEAQVAALREIAIGEHAGFLHYRASCYDPGRRCPYAKECDDCSTWDACGHVEKFRSEARQRLQAEGKIGPDARPKCDHEWQAAIEERGYQTCLKCGECRNIEDIPRTAPAWQITDERDEALWHAIKVLKENDIMEEPEEHLWDEEVTVLQAMMKEAGQ